MTRAGDIHVCEWCGKLCFGSKSRAVKAHSAAPWRIRAYLCPHQVGVYHVTNGEKIEGKQLAREPRVFRPRIRKGNRARKQEDT